MPGTMPMTDQTPPISKHIDLFPLGEDVTPYRKLTDKYVSTIEVDGQSFLKVEPEAIRLLAEEAFADINHLLRPGHLAQLASILDDPEATPNDRFVAFDLLKNANIAAGGVLPMCQDTGTAIIMGKRGRAVLTTGSDEKVMLKLSLPVVENHYKECVDHPNCLRVVALSGGYSREEANSLLSKQSILYSLWISQLLTGFLPFPVLYSCAVT